MDPKLILTQAPPLHPEWLTHEEAFNLLASQPIITDPTLNLKRYSDACKAINAELLAGRDKHLTERISISNLNLEAHPGSADQKILFYFIWSRDGEHGRLFPWWRIVRR
jgi:hypothetical protein